MKKEHQNLLIIFLIFTISFLFAFLMFIGLVRVFAASWAEPSTSPPGNNAPEPLNVSANSQYKSGGLGIGGIFRGYAGAVFDANVGIGTNSPSYLLDVAGGPGVVARIQGRGGPAGVGLLLENPFSGTNSPMLRFQDATGAHISLRKIGDSLAVIDNTGAVVTKLGTGGDSTYFTEGNFGIGTNSPTERLTVKGNLKVEREGQTTTYEYEYVGFGSSVNTCSCDTDPTTIDCPSSFPATASDPADCVDHYQVTQCDFSVTPPKCYPYSRTRLYNKKTIINTVGGDVFVEGNATVDSNLEVKGAITSDLVTYEQKYCGPTNFCVAQCSGGKKIIAGGCEANAGPNADHDGLFQSYPVSNTEWKCAQQRARALTVHLICQR